MTNHRTPPRLLLAGIVLFGLWTTGGWTADSGDLAVLE